MKLVVLDGFDEYSKFNAKIKNAIVKRLEGSWEVEWVHLKDRHIKPCRGCFGCWISSPGRCMIEDDSQEIIKSIINSDAVIYYTPLTFGGYSYELKKILDRSICLVMPYFMKINGEMHHRKRYDKYPALLGLGVTDKISSVREDNFKNLIYRNSINMHSPSYHAVVMQEDDSLVEEKVSGLLKNMAGDNN